MKRTVVAIVVSTATLAALSGCAVDKATGTALTEQRQSATSQNGKRKPVVVVANEVNVKEDASLQNAVHAQAQTSGGKTRYDIVIGKKEGAKNVAICMGMVTPEANQFRTETVVTVAQDGNVLWANSRESVMEK